MSTVYTHAVFKKFQVEVLGVVGCQPKKEHEDGPTTTFRVQDCEKDEYFMVTWNETKSEKQSEYRLGCNATMIYANEPLLSEEGSISEETYNIAFRTLVEALKNLVNVNNSNNTVVDFSGTVHSIREAEEENQGSLASKTSRKKITNRKRKVQAEQDVILVEAQDSLQQMDNLSSDGIPLTGYYGAQQNVHGLVQLNLMEPPHDSYYVNQQSMQGLGQLNSIAPNHDGFFGTQQSIHGLGQLDFRPSTSFSYSLQDDPHLRSSQLHGDTSRHS
ncbi:protein FAR-RED IMPAIRED RESPONSE 1 [Prunus yedoensis var. nudiflora]|uniref:Protein FAR-RED IMPAIRED RESPONSE 1 n=1 Tax=Prunus yedoensis var. nudiflora TaxID=2094558 RepID=A0A314YSW2_PRUYE|nr:protein FAR-RED IMPAIRED RESPONSE 1 [Prunus yedoensis var. nudiflora]